MSDRLSPNPPDIADTLLAIKIKIKVKMKFSTVFIFLFIFSINLSSQIKIVKEYSNISEIEPDAIFMEIHEKEKKMEPKNASLDSMRLALRNFDFDILPNFLSGGIQTEIDSLKNIFKRYSDLFNSKGEVYFKDKISQGYDLTETTGYVEFTSSDKSINDLKLLCMYQGERPKIYQILIIRNGGTGGNVKYEFPLMFQEINKAKEFIQLHSKMKNYDIVISEYEKLIERTSNIEEYYHNPKYGLTEKSNFYGNLAWYYALSNNASLVLENAEIGLELWPYNHWIKKNLVLGYVLKNDFEKAIEVYSKMENEYYKRDVYYKEIFISDLNRLKAENINVPNYSKYIEFLEKM